MCLLGGKSPTTRARVTMWCKMLSKPFCGFRLGKTCQEKNIKPAGTADGVKAVLPIRPVGRDTDRQFGMRCRL